MRRAGSTRPVAVAWLGALILAMACSGDNTVFVATATDTSVVDAPETGSRLDSAAEQAETGAIARSNRLRDPFADFGLGTAVDAEATESRPLQMWIVNQSGETAVITADAGAGIVVVDTLAAGDSVQVRLETRADSLSLTATGPSGVVLGQEWVGRRTRPVRAAFP